MGRSGDVGVRDHRLVVAPIAVPILTTGGCGQGGREPATAFAGHDVLTDRAHLDVTERDAVDDYHEPLERLVKQLVSDR